MEMSQSDIRGECLYYCSRMRPFLLGTHQQKPPKGCALELAAWGPVSKLENPVENVESQESNIGTVESRVGKSLLGYSIMTPEKRACRLTDRGR